MIKTAALECAERVGAMKFVKRPIVIEAEQYRAGMQSGSFAEDVIAGIVRYLEGGTMSIRTLEGEMVAHPGDWIIRGVKGELYPCRDDIFRASYDQVLEGSGEL